MAQDPSEQGSKNGSKNQRRVATWGMPLVGQVALGPAGTNHSWKSNPSTWTCNNPTDTQLSQPKECPCPSAAGGTAGHQILAPPLGNT